MVRDDVWKGLCREGTMKGISQVGKGWCRKGWCREGTMVERGDLGKDGEGNQPCREGME